MSSLQSSVVNLIARTIRSSFFIHKAETTTQRKSFERVANLAKFPRFVKFEVTSLGGLEAKWFYPKKNNNDRVVLYFHGGGYCVGSIKTHKALIARIARACKCPAVGINYRLAPEHPYPAALEDSYSAYKALIELGHRNIYLAGDSAGGGLALALCMRLRDENIQLPKASLLISPWVDLKMVGESIQTKSNMDPLIDPAVLYSFAEKYAGTEGLDNPYISPIYGDLSGLPPFLIQVGSNEVLLDDATRLAKKLKKAGCNVELEIWNKMFHVWHYLGGIIPEASQAIRQLGQYVKDIERKACQKKILPKKTSLSVVRTA
ncbi:MAG: alpha/beta hydrolase [Bacteroidetes bacterium]|nr:alpha/beta hydrolase [Bacteroidota bacterium]